MKDFYTIAAIWVFAGACGVGVTLGLAALGFFG